MQAATPRVVLFTTVPFTPECCSVSQMLDYNRIFRKMPDSSEIRCPLYYYIMASGVTPQLPEEKNA